MLAAAVRATIVNSGAESYLIPPSKTCDPFLSPKINSAWTVFGLYVLTIVLKSALDVVRAPQQAQTRSRDSHLTTW